MAQAISANFVDLTDTGVGIGHGETYVRPKMKPAVFEDAFVKAPMRVDLTDKTRYHIVVYNPFNHESVLAAAIMQNRFTSRTELPDGGLSETMTGNVKFVSYQDIIPTNAGTYIWLGVNPDTALQSPVNKKAKVIKYDYSQPAITKPREIGAISRMFGAVPLTETQNLNNQWYKYVNGPIDFDSEVQDPVYCTLVDKVMCDFGIEDIGKYGYRYLSTLCKGWMDNTVDEEVEPVIFVNIMEALASLENLKEFRVRYGSKEEREIYFDLLKTRYRVLTNKTSQQRLPTVNGYANTALMSVGPEMFYIAHRHFGKNGLKYLNVTQGLNGRLFVGNVRIKDAEFLGGKVAYVD